MQPLLCMAAQTLDEKLKSTSVRLVCIAIVCVRNETCVVVIEDMLFQSSMWKDKDPVSDCNCKSLDTLSHSAVMRVNCACLIHEANLEIMR